MDLPERHLNRYRLGNCTVIMSFYQFQHLSGRKTDSDMGRYSNRRVKGNIRLDYRIGPDVNMSTVR